MSWRREPSSLGIGVGRGTVRAALLRGSRFVAMAECAWDARDGTFAGAAESLFAALQPWTRELRRARITVAFGPSLCQVRRLEGLPSVDQATATIALRTNVSRWFLAPERAMRTSEVSYFAGEMPWGAVFDASTVEAVLRELAQRGLHGVRVLPTALALVESIEGPLIPWEDGKEAVVVRPEAGDDVAIERIAAGGLMLGEPTLKSLGVDPDAEAVRFADAFGAAVLGMHPERIRLALPAPDRDALPVSNRRATIARTALTIAAALALVAYPITAWSNAVATETALRGIAQVEGEAAKRNVALGEAAAAITAIDARRSERFSWVSLLAAITDSLPAGTALVTIHADSAAGTMVVLGPRAGTAIDRLERIPALVSPALIGPVTTETVNGMMLERATISFQVRRGGRR